MAPEQQTAGALEVRRADVGAEGVCRHEIAMPGAHLFAPHEVGAAEHPHKPVDPGSAVGHGGAGRRGQGKSHRLRSVALGHLAHACGRPVERLVPADALPSRIGIALRSRAPHRMEQPIGRVDQLGRGAALDAQMGAGWMRGVRLDGDQRAVLDHRDAAAARAAQRAEPGNSFGGHARPRGSLTRRAW